MPLRFEYGVTQIKNLRVRTVADPVGRTTVQDIMLRGEALTPTKRFWNSLHLRFGFTSNIFRYFSHQEVFDRISEVAPNNRIRWCVERQPDGRGKLLAVTNPTAGMIQHDDLRDLLDHYETEEITYADGIVTSQHTPYLNQTFQVAGEGFQNKFVLDVPIDGFGKPSVYLSLLRLVCSNGAVGYSPTFRSELSVGKGEGGVTFALERVLEGFNNEDGFAALHQRFESAARSWASVNEVQRLYKLLARMHNRGEIRGKAPVPAMGHDGAFLLDSEPLFRSFHKMTGDLMEIYGLANLDALSGKKQRTLPAACRVYDLLNFASEVGTHHTTEIGNRSAQAYVGDLISNEYDLEGTADQFADWRDFFISNENTTNTLAEMHKKSTR